MQNNRLSSRWHRAFRDYLPLLLLGLVYSLAVIAEAVYCHAPFWQVARVGYIVLLITVKCVLLLVAFGVWVYGRGLFLPEAKGKRLATAREHVSRVANGYLASDLFAYGCLGVPVLYANAFFFAQKSMLRLVNPYSWDPVFSGWDKALHLGHYPHELIIPFSDALGFGHVYDVAYYLWFLMMYLLLSYNLFLDRDRKRRLRVLWVFQLSWILLGSLAATLFASVGPLFYGDFYPDQSNPYAGLLEHAAAWGPKSFPIVWHTRDLLIEWTRSAEVVQPNALSAMPSLHMAIAWLAVLYTRTGTRGWFISACVFFLSIFFGSVYFGYHYAVDGYVSMAVVTIMWWAAGRLLGRSAETLSASGEGA